MINRLKRHITSFVILTVFIGSCLLSGCNNDQFSTDPGLRLSFSTDTLSFDTVFTTVGSATKRIMVRNTNSQAVRISHIGLAKQSNSAFRINVDGQNNANHQFSDVELRAKDSLYVFVEVKIDELNSNSPLIVEDLLVFETNGNNQQVVLNAFGQDVEFLMAKTIQNDTLLTADKPYVVYDSLVIAQGVTATIEAGARIYFHKDANFIVYGELHAEGTLENPIIMRGDRFDVINYDTPLPYNYFAGQWGGIYLKGNSGQHSMKHVTVNSGFVGIHIKNTEEDGIPTTLPSIEIVNCRIYNFLTYGLIAENADVTVVNSEISNTVNSCVYLQGGTHTFIHTTIANYYKNGEQAKNLPKSRKSEPAVMIMHMEKVAPMKTIFLNSIITGSYSNEFTLATLFPEQYDGLFKNCYIKRTDSIKTPQFQEIKWSEVKDTVFINTSFANDRYYNFQPDSVSPARGLADPAVITNMDYAKYGLQYDYYGKDRTQDGAPDAGAYEWFPAITEEE